jgi:hypothetical protein
VDFAIGKLGVHIGGSGGMKPTLYTKEIFPTQWYYYIIMKSYRAQQLLSYVNQEMTPEV